MKKYIENDRNMFEEIRFTNITLVGNKLFALFEYILVH